jgi:hypothetical protein
VVSAVACVWHRARQLHFQLSLLPFPPVEIRPHFLPGGVFSGVAFVSYASADQVPLIVERLAAVGPQLFGKKLRVELASDAPRGASASAASATTTGAAGGGIAGPAAATAGPDPAEHRVWLPDTAPPKAVGAASRRRSRGVSLGGTEFKVCRGGGDALRPCVALLVDRA